MTQHQPGPWDLDEEGRLFQPAARPALQKIRLISSWNEGAWDKSDAEVMANMRLMSAAPDLLDAVNALVGVLMQNASPRDPQVRVAMMVVDAALKKVKGTT